MSLEDRRAAMHGGHPDAEDLALFVEGRMPASARSAIESHLAACSDCRDVIFDARQMLEEEGRARVLTMPRRRWGYAAAAGLAAAAGVALAVLLAGPDVWPWRSAGSLDALVAAVANEPVRPLEGRLTGGFRHLPPPAATRGAEQQEPSPDVRIAAARVEQAADAGDASDAARGISYAVLGRLDEAVAALERAVQGNPKDARAQSDLSAVYLARSRRTGASEDAARALAAADRALAVDPGMQEGCFNRALALEQLSRIDDARKTWPECLRRENDADWAAEIRTHIAALPQ